VSLGWEKSVSLDIPGSGGDALALLTWPTNRGGLRANGNISMPSFFRHRGCNAMPVPSARTTKKSQIGT
jgi:hypothetical protein